MKNSVTYSRAEAVEKAIRSNSIYWTAYSKMIYNERLHEYLDTSPDFNPFTDFEIWLISRGFDIIELSQLTPVEPYRIYTHILFDKIITIILDKNENQKLFQIDDEPLLYQVPDTFADFASAVKGNLPYINEQL